MRNVLLVTGAAGGVGSLLRPRLLRLGWRLRLLDVRPPAEPLGAGEELILASITDVEAMTAACAGVDAVLHLGGQSVEAPVEQVLELNMLGTYSVLEAARRVGVSRVIIASSNHAAGFHQRGAEPVPADAPPRPDTLYGWSKVAAEAVGRLYHDRFGMDVICLRIGFCFETPSTLRALALWLSPDDGARLVEACLTAPSPGYRIVWGISRNTRRWCSLAEGEAIGYHPQDDAEVYADKLIAEHGEPDFTHDPLLSRIGGQWCEIPLGVRMS
ncbi:NAD-dependent epimerase/dehydratase family protein [Micromonospora mirobrigensis]|uniref:NAD dependent epimerase/dehydratase family protein n=1 Tax=Micromonospora mirobrigensis TaxID=262898 RepID=A0A1C5AKX6_9ACTN|nr:NAD(P)-dependent oxidoreductase [Micromonospora mirobrigensis]SCF45776.1 NAD dependent epimerase/dehydratase family protein [Micromonospora mirobrigensis]